MVREIREGRHGRRGRSVKRELRASVQLLEERGSVGRIVGTIIEEGRIAGDRAEVFTAGVCEVSACGDPVVTRAPRRRVRI